MKSSELELLLEAQILTAGLPQPVKEYKFHPTRKWRVDFAFVDKKLMIEVEGGSWNGGRHVSGSGFEKDAEKYNEAAILGWTVIRVTGKMINSKDLVALEFVKRAYSSKV
jgi:very-short-patch-repair endonuclease